MLTVITQIDPGMWKEKEKDKKTEIIQRKYAKDPTLHEPLIVVILALGIYQYSGDEKTAHHEEHFHEHPGSDKCAGKIMGQHHKGNSDSPPPVEFFHERPRSISDLQFLGPEKTHHCVHERLNIEKLVVFFSHTVTKPPVNR
jgi:hypothetical protein